MKTAWMKSFWQVPTLHIIESKVVQVGRRVLADNSCTPIQTRQRTWIRNCHSGHVVVLRGHVKKFLLRDMPCSTCSKTTGLTTRNLTRASLASFFIRYATFCHIRHAHDLAPAKSKTSGPWGLAKSYIGSSKIVQKLNFQVDWAHILRTCNM